MRGEGDIAAPTLGSKGTRYEPPVIVEVILREGSCGSSSGGLERNFPKVEVASSNLVSRLAKDDNMALYTTPKETTWKEFQSTGLLLFINTFLHIFGWCIVIECDDEGTDRAYPARTSWRGFPEDSMTRAYQKLTKKMQEDLPQLLEDTKE